MLKMTIFSSYSQRAVRTDAAVTENAIARQAS